MRFLCIVLLVLNFTLGQLETAHANLPPLTTNVWAKTAHSPRHKAKKFRRKKKPEREIKKVRVRKVRTLRRAPHTHARRAQHTHARPSLIYLNPAKKPDYIPHYAPTRAATRPAESPINVNQPSAVLEFD